MSDSPIKTIARKAKLTPSDVRAAIQSLCAELDYDPFRELIIIAQETLPTEINGEIVQIPIADTDQRITIAKEIASYLAPKLKTIEVEGNIKNDFTFTVRHVGEDGKDIDGLKMADVVSPVARQIEEEVVAEE